MSTTALPPALPLGTTGGVSGTKLKGSAWGLQEAEFLDLLYVPNAPAAEAMVAASMPLVEALEGRTRPRGTKERTKLSRALAAVLGGVLIAALTKGRMVHRPLRKVTFDGGIGYLQVKPVLDGLERRGFLIRHPGIQFLRAIEGPAAAVFAGMSTRFEATPEMYELADLHGLTAETVTGAFVRAYPEKPAKVPQFLTLKTYEARAGRRALRGGGGAGVPVPIKAGDAKAATMRGEIRLGNVALARCQWANCQPPRLYRAFRGDWTLGGRWVIAGAVTIQTMSPAARLLITVDGDPVAEVDATASQLTILAGLAGITQLPMDPYCLPGYSRNAVKRAVITTLGNGRLPRRWPERTLGDYPELAGVDMKPLAAVLAAAFPFLNDPGAVLGIARDRVALRLQALEAEILTSALVPLWRGSVPAVPIHDGILCPEATAARVIKAMREAYKAGAGGAVVSVTVDGAT